MGFAWNPVAIPGLLLGPVEIGLAIVLIITSWRRPRAPGRWLAAAVAVEGGSIFFGFGLGILATDARTAYVCQAINTTLFLLLPFTFLSFLSFIDSPLVRPLGTKTARVIMAAATLALLALWALKPALFIEKLIPLSYAAYDIRPGPAFGAFQASLTILLLFSLAVSISAWRRAAPGSISRRRAASYAVAFTARDTLLIIAIVGLTIATIQQGRTPDVIVTPPLAIYLLVPIANLVGSTLLAYGILRTQLFDIDLRIKHGIERSTVVTIVAIASIVTGKVVDHYAQAEWGWYAAIGVAIGMLFFSRALERVGHRVANTALPQVQPTETYLAYKKLDVYRSALEEALLHGPLDAKERAILDRLRASLAIPEPDAAALEADVAASHGAIASEAAPA